MNISIAMATYNGQRFLRAQLDSLARQTLPPAELVVCDDGSNDETLEIIAGFAAAAPFPVQVHRNEARLGYADNFLKAARLCQGELIAFCDQDDVWCEDKLARCAAPFVDPAVLQVIHSADVVDGDLRPTGSHCPDFPATRTVDVLQMDPWYTPFGFAMVVSAQLLPFFGEPRPQTYFAPVPQAHDQWSYFLSTALGKSVFLADRLALYRQHGTNATGAAVTDAKTTARQTVQAGEDHYRWLTTVAAGYAASLSDLVARHAPQAAALERAAAYYAALAATYGQRTGLYQRETGRLRRVSRLLELLRTRSYRSRARGGLGGTRLGERLVLYSRQTVRADTGNVLMTDQPLVTVAIRTRNRAPYLRLAAESVLTQSYRNIDLVISDEASSDDTPALCQELTRADPRVRIYRHDPPRGVYGNWQFCFESGRGKYFALLDDDNLYLPGFLEKLIAALEANPQAGFAFADEWVIDDDGERLPAESRETSQRYGRASLPPGLQPDTVLVAMQQSPGINSAVSRYDVFAAVGGFRPLAGELADFDAFVNLAANDARSYYVAERLVEYRIHKAQNTDKLLTSIDIAQSHVRILESYHFQGPAERLRRRNIAIASTNLSRVLLLNNDLPGARQAINAGRAAAPPRLRTLLIWLLLCLPGSLLKSALRWRYGRHVDALNQRQKPTPAT